MNKKVRPNGQSGMAMIFTLMAIIVIAGTLAVAMTRSQSTKTQTDHALDEIILEEAAQAGIDIVTRDLWRQYLDTSGNTTRNWASYRAYLNSTLNIPINEDLNGNGEMDSGEDGNGNGEFDVPSGVNAGGVEMLDEPFTFQYDENDNARLADVTSVRISRFDGISHSWLTVRSTAEINGKTKTAVQVLEVGAPTRNHAQFAILANNISCILCHADILSLDLERNNDPDMFNSFDRIKVASLESILVRRNGANSDLAGTLYTRGRVYDDRGNDYGETGLSNTSFNGFKHSTENGKIVQDGSGNMTSVSLEAADTTPDGDLEQFANLYLDYPLEESEQTDGSLPNSFPAPYPDEDNDRMVDDDEFLAIKNTADGSISFESGGDDQGGSITAGVAHGVPDGEMYMGDAMPATSTTDAVNALQTEGFYEGNLILKGTDDDPINIDGTVAIDGDLVIEGPIKGEGQLLVRGNTYVVGDVTYADGTEFGVAEDGTENAFAIVSGGSVMMGDFTTIRGVNHSSRTGDKYPRWQKHSIDVRQENVVGYEDRNGSNEALPYGYFDQYSTDPNTTDPAVLDNRPGKQFSFTMSELQLFNKLELDKALEDPDYTPRFYGLRESQPDNIFIFDTTKANNEEHAVQYDYKGVYDLKEYLLEFGLDPDIAVPQEQGGRAAFHYLTPKNGWLPEDTLRQIWYDDEMTRPSSGRPFKFDGLLYSNNSIFSIVRSDTRHNSNSEGEMIMRGGIIAADLGIFVPGGLDLMYDPRVERFIELRDANEVTYQRLAFYFEEPQGAESVN